MNNQGLKNSLATLNTLGLSNYPLAHWNLSPEQLTQATINRSLGETTDVSVLSIKTGEFTGRSPKDRFIVKDACTQDSVDWGAINQPFDAEKYAGLKEKLVTYLDDKELYVHDGYVCADKKYALNVRLVAEYPWSCQFAYNMFRRLTESEVLSFEPDWTILCAPGFMADPLIDGTRQHNFSIINFTEKTIIIGGTGYTGEIKKGIFSVLNFELALYHDVLPMHCSANIGEEGDTAIFFGLSGTGKTTLSSDPKRKLIGDDEHGWSSSGVFNFEGGCYAKCINLSAEKEPEIYQAIKPGAILENIIYENGTKTPDYDDGSITLNTRVSYPLHHIQNLQSDSKGSHPERIFFLTCDAFGVLPPVSKLTWAQTIYYFLSGYTAKVAGTEAGINEPEATFSACFGAPFLPLAPTHYAGMLGQKLYHHKPEVWLINTGWTGGPYGVGSRIKLSYTRAMLSAIMDGSLADAVFEREPVFGLRIPNKCEGVPTNLLNPKMSWRDKQAYDLQAQKLVLAFHQNFQKFGVEASSEVREAGPRLVPA